MVAGGRAHRLFRPVDPGLGERRAVPALQGCGEIDLAPFWMARRLLERIEVGEEAIHELRESFVTRRIVLPVERDQDRAHRDSIDALPFGNEVRIIVMRERRGDAFPWHRYRAPRTRACR